jgi:hypothetical protein
MHHPRLVGGLAALAALLILLAAPVASALPLRVVWSDHYGATANDGFTALAAGSAGAVYAAGFTEALGAARAPGSGGQLLLVKYVDSGATMSREWVRTFAVRGVTGASASKVAVDAAGDVIVAGTVGVPDLRGKGSDIVVLKYSSAGALLWKTTYDGPGHREDYVNGLALDAQGNALVVGASVGRGTARDYVTIKVRAEGSRAWVRRYAGPGGFDEARGVAVDAAGNVYVTGWSNGKPTLPKSGMRRSLTVSYTPAGAQRWIATVGRRHSWSGAAAVMLSDVRGARGVIISGYQGDRASGDENLMFVKYDPSSGKAIWKRILANGATTEPHAAAVDGSGAPIAAGMSNRPGGIQGYIAGVSASGGDAWHSALSSEFGTPGWAEFDALAVGAGGSVLAGGWAQSAEPPTELYSFVPSAFVVRYSPSWPMTEPLDYIGAGSATSDSRCTAVAIGANGMYAVGQESSTPDGLDAVLIKF